MEETEDVNARDQLNAGRVEVVVPTVDDELKPKLKMEFDSLDKGYSFYNNYSLACGFGIREHNSKNSGDGDCLVRKEFVCCKKAKIGWMLIPNRIEKVGREMLGLSARRNLHCIGNWL